MTGQVNDRLEAVIDVTVRSKQAELSIQAIIDTGFSDYLTLPDRLVSGLNLPFHTYTDVELATGRIEQEAVYRAQVNWNGSWLNIFVHATEGSVVAGMKLLENHTVTIEVVPGGVVDIDE